MQNKGTLGKELISVLLFQLYHIYTWFWGTRQLYLPLVGGDPKAATVVNSAVKLDRFQPAAFAICESTTSGDDLLSHGSCLSGNAASQTPREGTSQTCWPLSLPQEGCRNSVNLLFQPVLTCLSVIAKPHVCVTAIIVAEEQRGCEKDIVGTNSVCCCPSTVRSFDLLSNVWTWHLNYENTSWTFTTPETISLNATCNCPHPGPGKCLRCQWMGFLRVFLLGLWRWAPFSPRR